MEKIFTKQEKKMHCVSGLQTLSDFCKSQITSTPGPNIQNDNHINNGWDMGQGPRGYQYARPAS